MPPNKCLFTSGFQQAGQTQSVFKKPGLDYIDQLFGLLWGLVKVEGVAGAGFQLVMAWEKRF
jgi:hypothetical protein